MREATRAAGSGTCAVALVAAFFAAAPTAGQEFALVPVQQPSVAPVQAPPAQALALPPPICSASGPTGCGEWQWANPRPQGNDLNGLAYGANRFVATGRKGTVLTSSNGTDWVVQPATTSRTISSTTWVGSQFMAGVSDESGQVSGAVMTSPDGITWTERTTGTNTRVNAFATNGTTIVAVGWTGHVLTTNDGVSWTARPSGTTNGLFDVVWAGTEFVAIGRHSTIVKSPDGITWTAYQLAVGPLVLDLDLQSASWSGSVLVIVTRSYGYGIFTSTDRQTFTNTKSGYFNAVTWGRGRFVAAGNEIWSSSDGVDWVRASDSAADLVAWGAEKFVATDYWALAASDDGLTWTEVSYSATAAWPTSIATVLGMAFSSETYVAVGMCSVTITSHDGGATWQGPSGTQSCGSAHDLYGVARSPALFVAVGTRGTVRASADGTAWTDRTSGTTSDLNAVIWTGSRFVAVGDSGIVVTSPDGTTWSRAASAGTPNLFDVATNGQRLVAVGKSAIVTSEDGLQWTDRSAGVTKTLLGVAWSGERFVAVGTNVVMTSPDGITWTEQPAGASYELSGITAGAGHLLAVGYRLIMTSTDGVSWQELGWPSYYGFFDSAAWDGTSFFIGGDHGLILRSSCAAEPEALYIEAAAHAAGAAGSNWRTDLELHNPGSAGATVTLDLLRRDQDNSSPQSASLTIAPQASARLEDVLLQRFDFPGAAALRVRSSPGAVIATSRTYNATPEGTYGWFGPAFASSSAVAAGTSARLIGLRQSPGTTSGSRSNVGFVNTTAVPITVTAELFSAQGVSLGIVPVDLRAFEYRQLDRIFERVTSQPIEGGYAVVRTATPGGRFLAYAAVIDNRTNDPVYVPASSEASAESLYFGAAAHAGGAAGTVWRTDLDVHNPGSTQATYALELLRRDQPNPTPTTITYSLAPGLSAVYGDALWTAFAFSGAGSVRVTPAAGTVMATCRTYNLTPSGTYGQFVPGQPITRAVSYGKPGRLIGLSHDASLAAGYRANLGMVSATASSIVVEVALHDVTGTRLGVRQSTLAPYESKQIDRIFEQVTSGVVSGGYAVVSTPTAGGKFFAYASVIDNRTGDPICVPIFFAP